MFALHRHRTRQAFTAASVALVTGLAAACGISAREEVRLGQRYAEQINRELPIVEDAAVNRYINVLGNRIARQGGRELDYRFYVVNSERVNAFAVPGGHVYVNRGLIERTDNVAELAGVLAHEIGHVEERHGVEQLERVQRANVGLMVASVLLGPPGPLARTAAQVGGAAVFASYSRAAEREADAVAVPLLIRSGINPNGLVTFFKTLLEEREREPNIFEQWFSTHPLTEERIAETRAMIREIPPDQLERLASDTRDFRAFRQRVRQLPPPPRDSRRDR